MPRRPPRLWEGVRGPRRWTPGADHGGSRGAARRPLAIVTRRWAAARLDQPVVVQTRPTGRRPVSWPRRRAWGYGRRRSCRDQQRRGRWAVRGPQLPVHVWVRAMVGDDEPGGLVTAARELTAAQGVEAGAARFRQEDGLRAPNQRLGMEA
jgi:hypothetical protein